MAATYRGIIPFLPPAAAKKRAVLPSAFCSSKSSSVIKATRLFTKFSTCLLLLLLTEAAT
ncbi:hypothetical protein M8C21_032189 [Ambrosia artemisiifolia]|uniref:Uncharacterized protein n=1 Tax=Ambrosia artemisiifolia TaxID=4212 RepID=A0AAD5CKD2_AMBAR|nr:hypothetical protein M8C21_032189 [Ambrosia artemisiifolia]